MTAIDIERLNASAVAKLRRDFRGALLQPGEEGYDEARRVWNGAIDRRPALIARCAGADDVVRAVRFGRERDLLVSVRGGGHAVAGYAVCDGGLMIDLSLMKSVRVEPDARTARAAGGALWGDLDRVTQRFGLATTGGIISHTGIGGLTLGGGLGHLMRKHGFTVDNLLTVDLVTAEGESLRCDAETEPELFWGLRGGGGNFGIATAFEYRLHPVGPMILGGAAFWSAEDGPEILRYTSDLVTSAPDDLGITFVVRLAPPAPFVPVELYGKPVVGLVLLWAGDPAEGEKALAALKPPLKPVAEFIRPMPYVALQSMLDAGAAHGMHYYWKSQRLPELSEPVIDVLTGGLGSMPTAFSQIGGWAVGGAASRVDPDATAVGPRPVSIEVNVVGAWPPSDGDGAAHTAWVRAAWDVLRPHSTGLYANFVSDEGAAGVRTAYGERLRRLTELKDRFDPTNFFRMNPNIQPSREGGR